MGGGRSMRLVDGAPVLALVLRQCHQRIREVVEEISDSPSEPQPGSADQPGPPEDG
jgi:hypothetical protein